ncbi:MAG: endonuclease/exonuclease/phosphatase family protein [Bacteroidota bacterium]
MNKTIALVLMLIIPVTHLVLGQQLNIMTYNIRYDNPSEAPNNWENRKDRIVTQINTYAPGILGIQEGLQNQVDYLEKELEGYRYFGVGREDGMAGGEYTAIFYDPTKIRLLDKATFWLSQTPQQPSVGWDAALKRICTYGLFQYVSSKSKFFVFNTHFDHIGEKARLESAKLILSKAKAINSEKFPWILIGDFNLEPNSKAIQLILESLSDAHSAAGNNATGPQGTFNGFDDQQPVTRRIDYIFFDASQLRVLKSTIINDRKDGRYPSDHFPVYAELFLK